MSEKLSRAHRNCIMNDIIVTAAIIKITNAGVITSNNVDACVQYIYAKPRLNLVAENLAK